MEKYRTPLSKVNGVGTARSGVHEFITHRVSAIIIALVLPFILYGMIKALPHGYEGLMAWVHSPLGAFTLLIFITAGLYHGRLGVNEVIADYVPSLGARSFWLLVVALLSFSFWLIGVLAILKIWLGA
ncbi:MAG TPA: succinate dehydrogenase, hydrophobic membrane anchor protein [Hellea balneolensis]|uniref:Succinate dehydrogenase hydrophobic membrane anchor subunit n=1 Tax=Hellea balneolensis TaxID=287478 RepID=A0A7C5R7U8_9PROT|nr:succinate dehydrogenase, hydrophobic membrane anchor protein [Hellea balneolensis]